MGEIPKEFWELTEWPKCSLRAGGAAGYLEICRITSRRTGNGYALRIERPEITAKSAAEAVLRFRIAHPEALLLKAGAVTDCVRRYSSPEEFAEYYSEVLE